MLMGLIMTLLIALASKLLVGLPILSVMGTMVTAIVLGMIWRAVIGVKQQAQVGIDFSAKKLLRLGIILMGIRLDISDILAAGPKVVLMAVLVISFAMLLIPRLGKRFGVDTVLAVLVASGTAICGAAAIAGVAPMVKADEQRTAVSIAIIAILGTVFTFAYTFLNSVFTIPAYTYGILSGSTLHELGHVIAASSTGGQQSMDIALIIKLTRVAFLVPVAFILGIIFMDKDDRKNIGFRDLPIPWFVLGFIAFSIINTIGILSPSVTDFFTQASVFIMTMAMAGLGLNVDFKAFGKMGGRALGIGIIGSVALSVFGGILTMLLF